MELNSINKTGTWSEAADRLNYNFSKTSTEIDKVKQNLSLIHISEPTRP